MGGDVQGAIFATVVETGYDEEKEDDDSSGGGREQLRERWEDNNGDDG